MTSRSNTISETSQIKFNYSQFLEFYENDEELVEQIYTLFVGYFAKIKSEIEKYLEEDSKDELSRALHRLKGAVMNFQCSEIVEDIIEQERRLKAQENVDDIKIYDIFNKIHDVIKQIAQKQKKL